MSIDPTSILPDPLDFGKARSRGCSFRPVLNTQDPAQPRTRRSLSFCVFKDFRRVATRYDKLARFASRRTDLDPSEGKYEAIKLKFYPHFRWARAPSPGAVGLAPRPPSSDCGPCALRVPIGVAVRAGAPKPEISSVEAFKRTVFSAKSIAYLKGGSSGPYLESLFDRWGIGAELQPKSKRPDTDIVGELVARGEAEIGVTAIATMIATPGVDIVGPIPTEIQSPVLFTAAVGAKATAPDVARELIKIVTGAAAAPVIKSKGMEPW